MPQPPRAPASTPKTSIDYNDGVYDMALNDPPSSLPPEEDVKGLYSGDDLLMSFSFSFAVRST